MEKITLEMLTEGQRKGFELFTQFYLSPYDTAMRIEGWSGTGKSSLVRLILEEIPRLEKAASVIDMDFEPYEVVLTATTNQACESLCASMGPGFEVSTIHSKLGLRVDRDYKTGKTKLVVRRGADKLYRSIILVDEASFIDQELLGHIFNQTEDCKFVFIGDPCQLTPVGSTFMPAFKQGSLVVELTEMKRQRSGPLFDLCVALRGTVMGKGWPSISPDGKEIIRAENYEQFEEGILHAFKNPDKFGHTKVLSFHNNRVEYFNKKCSDVILGSSAPQEGQRMLVNQAVINKAGQLSTGQEVYIDELKPFIEFGVAGWMVKLRGISSTFFLPAHRKDRMEKEKALRAAQEWNELRIIDENWVDLRPAFACTVNKSQGSTYDWAFVDIGDISKGARGAHQLARLLYVGISRARLGVVLAGDLS